MGYTPPTRYGMLIDMTYIMEQLYCTLLIISDTLLFWGPNRNILVQRIILSDSLLFLGPNRNILVYNTSAYIQYRDCMANIKQAAINLTDTLTTLDNHIYRNDNFFRRALTRNQRKEWNRFFVTQRTHLDYIITVANGWHGWYMNGWWNMNTRYLLKAWLRLILQSFQLCQEHVMDINFSQRVNYISFRDSLYPAERRRIEPPFLLYEQNMNLMGRSICSLPDKKIPTEIPEVPSRQLKHALISFGTLTVVCTVCTCLYYFIPSSMV